VFWIASKLLDVFLNPFKCFSLILQSVVQAQARIRNYLTASQESIRPYSIVEVHHNHAVVASIDQVCTIVVGIAVDVEATALDEDVDRQLALVGGSFWRENIDE
jgi:hypothetical protein